MQIAIAYFIILAIPTFLFAQAQFAPQPTQTQLQQYPQAQVMNGPEGTTTASPNIPSTVNTKIGERDPFAPPKYIRELELIRPKDLIDNKMEAIRRWPLSDYKLQGIIWDVKNPKAIIVDKLKTLHLLKKNYRIGHREGIISEIHESEIIVLQKGLPIVIPIQQSNINETQAEATKLNEAIKEMSPEQIKRLQELSIANQNAQKNGQQNNVQGSPVAPQNAEPAPSGGK